MLLMAAAIPAISAFRRGQKLEHGQRMVISALNDARRAAITRHARHVVVLFEYEERPGEVDTIRHALRIYQEPTGVPKGPGIPPSVSAGYWPGGYQGEALRLPAGTRFKKDRMEVRVQLSTEDGPDKDAPIFARKLKGQGRNADAIAFRRDGSVEDRPDATATDVSTGINVYLPDEGCYQVPDIYRADIALYESSPSGDEIKTRGKSRRALIDLNGATGRSIGRVFDIGGSAPEFLRSGGQ